MTTAGDPVDAEIIFRRAQGEAAPYQRRPQDPPAGEVDRVDPVTAEDVVRQAREHGRGWWLPRRTWLAAAAAALLVAAAVAVGVLVDRPGGPGGVVIAPEIEDWTTFRSQDHGFEIAYPPDWNRAEHSLIPQLAMPSEIITITTGPTVAGSDCGPVADRAMRALDDDGMLITIMSRASDTDAFPARPERFDVSDAIRVTTEECAPEGFWHKRFDFRQNGRAFYAYVTVGPQADRDVALEVLNTFHVIDGHPQSSSHRSSSVRSQNMTQSTGSN